LKMCLQLWGTGCGFSMTQHLRTVGKMSISGWMQHIQQGKVDVSSRLHGLFSHQIYLQQIFSCGDTWRSIYEVPPRTIEDLVARLQAAVTMVNANLLRLVHENAVWCTAICLEMDKGCFEQLL
jgi:hypothetical protein